MCVYIYIYIYIYALSANTCPRMCSLVVSCVCAEGMSSDAGVCERSVWVHPAAVRCDMVLHQAFRARHAHNMASVVRCDMVLHRAFRTRHI